MAPGARRNVFRATSLLAFTLAQPLCFSHAPEGIGSNPRGLLVLDWQAQHISRTLTAGYPDSLGLYSFLKREPPVLSTVAGQRCVSSNFLSLDVSDSFAFDIDETVTLDLLLDSTSAVSLLYAYDGIGNGAPTSLSIEPSGEGRLRSYHLELPRARFANRGMAQTDIALATLATMDPTYESPNAVFTLCGLVVRRNNKLSQKTLSGEIQLHVRDAGTGTTTAARVGIYDSTGRAVLPAQAALAIPYYDEWVRSFVLRGSAVGAQPWPVANRHVFYTDGRYRGHHPAGQYTLVVSKGPEYRQLVKEFVLPAGESVELNIELSRWLDMPERGWYSGDVHVHASRNRADNAALANFMQAEDVRVSNLLQMGNAEKEHFLQYAWGQAGTYKEAQFSLVPGIESPRTAVRGHTIALNIQSPQTDREHYFLYHRFLDRYQAQGAVTGYAHVGSEEFYASRGLALDVPFGLVDFVEVMQNNHLRTGLWYEFLNLGFQLAPAAGSDFPYFDQPGAVRSYVAIDGSYSPDKWLSGLQQGRSFVSNGPMLEFSVNNALVGDTLNPASGSTLNIRGRAFVNPDIDKITELALIRCGEPVQDVTGRLEGDGSISIQAEIPSMNAGWLALRAKGNQTLAHSGAIYVASETGFTGCKNKVPATVVAMEARLDDLSNTRVETNRELEYWEVGNIASLFEVQKAALDERIKLARVAYKKLLSSNR